MINILLAFLVSFTFSVMCMPLIISFFERKKAGQTILGYVENHKEKNGTLTMGGVVYIISALFLAFFFLKYDAAWIMCLLVSIFFGVLGFLDDYIKIKHKENMGLKPYQKIIGQAGISIIFALFVYFYNGGIIFIPFVAKTFDIGFWIVPLIILTLVACTNSVNLTDGLDGLAGNTTFFYLIFFVAIIWITKTNLFNLGETSSIIDQIEAVSVLSMIFAGSILGFLMFNTNKATIFMGDVGSLCLGGFVGASACLLGFELIVPILGFCFVFSAISVILQVISFKLTKKRIFKMAPFHHHLQMSGFSEPKIVAFYSATTIILGVICLIFYLL